MILRVVGYVLLAFVVFGPAAIASLGGDPGLGLLVFVTTLVTLVLGVAGSWLILKGSPPPREWEQS
jgi:hypothetical protein